MDHITVAGKVMTSQSAAASSQYSENSRCLWQLAPGGSDGKESACNAGDPGSISGSGRSPEEGNDNPLQNSFLGNPMDREAWWATVHKITKSQI